ncbi:MAG: flagellar assembly protein FliH [Betaproteobacteria bacterium]|nr:flagellar assembly protein FliH [Betaproteobacteria bacterium]
MPSDNAGSGLTAWERWELASFDAPSGPRKEASNEPEIKLPTAEEIEQIFQQARQTGHAAGYAEGQAQARAEGARLVALATQLDLALTEMDQQVAEDLLALALDVARQVIRQALVVKPDLLLETVREALALMQHPHATIHLHPDDASLVRSYLGDQLAHAGHRIHEDRRLERGGCLIEAGGSQLDAGMATRWRRTVESLGSNAEWLMTPEATESAATGVAAPDEKNEPGV